MGNIAPPNMFRRAAVLAMTSAALLILAFPSFNQSWAAWIALVPWLLFLRGATPRAALLWSSLIGFVFFLASMWWLIHVTVAGWLILCAYLALYFGAFGWLVTALATRRKDQATGRTRWGRREFIWLVPAVWVASEYARSRVLSGLGWNLLAYSQTTRLQLIQIADVTGVWGVSFVVVLVNVVIADMLHAVSWRKGRRAEDHAALPQATSRLTAGLIVWLLALAYGAWRLDHLPAGSSVRVAVVQGNIPQEEKWDEAARESIVSRYEGLTREAARSRPQLIVWPETATPGYLDLDEFVTQRVSALARSVGIPLLVGAPMGYLDAAQWRITNSAALLDPDGAIRQRYDKLHLVPFGEFVPFEAQAPWLRGILPPIGEFSPGMHPTVFRLANREPRATSRAAAPPPFSVLICFEDIFPQIARRFVREGARLLLVITNDAWFGPTAAAYQHAQASTFRAVELRVPVVRAANTGWSGCIDPAVRWVDRVHHASGKELFVAGTQTCEVPTGSSHTVYCRWGDWFALGCVLVSLGVLGTAFRRHSSS